MKGLLIGLFLLTVVPVVHAVELRIENPLIEGSCITFDTVLTASSDYYLQAALKAEGGSYYFGETLNNSGDWIDYQSNPDKEYIVSSFFRTSIVEASWSGQLKLRFFVDSAKYMGPGNYLLKLNRFTGNSSSPAGESNTLTLQLELAAPTPTPSPTTTPASTVQPSASSSPSSPNPPTPTPTIFSPAPSLTAIPSATVAGLTITSLKLPTLASPPPSPPLAPSVTPLASASSSSAAIYSGSGLLTLAVAVFLKSRYN